MTKRDLETAVSEAERFLQTTRGMRVWKTWDLIPQGSPLFGKEAAACKRASLDLTRALAQLRKTN